LLNVLQPFLATATAQAAATVQLTDEVRALRVVLEAYVGSLHAVPSDGPSVDDDQLPAVACPHPEGLRVSFASSGSDDFFCKACQTMVARPHALKGLN